jgi:small subunit ribosomal protein S8
VRSKSKKNKSFKFDDIRVVLKYKKSGRPVITCLKRISKPGLRVYVNKDNLPKVLNNIGIAIISTPEGLMTNKEAKKKKLGGEIICEIY